MSNGGDKNVYWIHRRDRVVATLHKLLQQCPIVVTQENDHPVWIWKQLQEHQTTLQDSDATSQSKSSSIQMHKWSQAGKPSRRFYISRLHDALVASNMINESVAESSGNKAALTEQKYQQVNQFFLDSNNNALRQQLMTEQGLTCTTNFEEGVVDAIEEGANHLYQNDESLTVYYDASKVELLSASSPTEPIHQLEFRLKEAASDKVFTVFPAHLKSGESLKDERRRVQELEPILQQAQNATNPIVVMDSNHSMNYEETIRQEETPADDELFLTELIQKSNFMNLIPQEGNENLKMRHAQGGQPKKFGSLMFDAIDKILVPLVSNSAQPSRPIVLSDDVFVKYPPAHRECLLELRNNPHLRKILKDTCIQQKWGPNMENNAVDMSVWDKDFAEKVEQECGGLHNLLMGLYPNAQAPSDHPPVAAIVHLL